MFVYDVDKEALQVAIILEQHPASVLRGIVYLLSYARREAWSASSLRPMRRATESGWAYNSNRICGICYDEINFTRQATREELLVKPV